MSWLFGGKEKAWNVESEIAQINATLQAIQNDWNIHISEPTTTPRKNAAEDSEGASESDEESDSGSEHLTDREESPPPEAELIPCGFSFDVSSTVVGTQDDQQADEASVKTDVVVESMPKTGLLDTAIGGVDQRADATPVASDLKGMATPETGLSNTTDGEEDQRADDTSIVSTLEIESKPEASPSSTAVNKDKQHAGDKSVTSGLESEPTLKTNPSNTATGKVDRSVDDTPFKFDMVFNKDTHHAGDKSVTSGLESEPTLKTNPSDTAAGKVDRSVGNTPFKFNMVFNSMPATKPIVRMRPRRPGKSKVRDKPTSGFSSGNPLEPASRDGEVNYAAMFTNKLYNRHIDERTLKLHNPIDIPPTNEEVRDAIAYSSMAKISTGPFPEEVKQQSNTNVFSITELLDAIKNASSSPANVRESQQHSEPSKQDNNIHLPSSTGPRKPQLNSTQNHQSSCTLHLLNSSFPDKENIFYHPKMTLQLAAQQIVTNFRAANEFLAHYCDDQFIYTSSTFKPTVITQLERMVRDLRFAAQFLSLGKLGWDLVTLPHAFFEDVKVLVGSLLRCLGKLNGRKELRFLADGLEAMDRVEEALWFLQGRRTGLEYLTKIEWEAKRAGEAKG